MKLNAKLVGNNDLTNVIVDIAKKTCVSITEVSELLQLTDLEVSKLIKNNELPFVHKDGSYTFLLSDIFILMDKNGLMDEIDNPDYLLKIIFNNA